MEALKKAVAQKIAEQIMGKIDEKTLEVTTLKIGEWDRLGHDARGYYKNMKTGAFTMVPLMVCGACGAKIPMPELLLANPPADVAAARKAAKCPKCGKNPFPPEPRQ